MQAVVEEYAEVRRLFRCPFPSYGGHNEKNNTAVSDGFAMTGHSGDL